MKRLLIVGASGMGREVAEYAKACFSPAQWTYGFLDNRPELLKGREDLLPPIVGTAEEIVPQPGDAFLIALGEAAMRRKYVAMLECKGATFATLIHPDAMVLASATIAPGCIVCPHAAVSSGATIGRHTILNIGASVSHDGNVGDYVTFSPGARTAGWCELGNDVFLGVNAVLLPRVRLAPNTIVGAGAVVTQNCPFPGKTLVGVPAKPLSN